MNSEQIHMTFKGYLNSSSIACITSVFRRYRINITDLELHNITGYQSTLFITINSSSTTDEIDSFWQEIEEAAEKLDLQYSKKYIQKVH